jgi:malic enzyme
VTETLPQDTRTPQVQVSDEEIFEAHVGGKLSVELKAPLDTQRALSIAYTQQMMVAAAEAIFSVVGDDLAPDRIVPSPLDPRVCPAVAEAVAGASGV